MKDKKSSPASKKKAVKKVAPKASKKKAIKKSAPKAGKKAAKKAVKRTKKAEKIKVEKTVTTVTTTTTTTTTKIAPAETHYLLILDESGSMQHVRQQTLDGLNEQIQAINKLEKQYPDHKYFINILKFDNEFRDLIVDTKVSKVKHFTLEDYKPNASTALRDAIGFGVNRLNEKIENKINSGEAKALVVILTDGEENASTKYSPADIKALITRLDATQSWTFTFIGANQDSVTTANSYGIHTSNVANYTGSQRGTYAALAAVSAGMSNVASGYASFIGGGTSNRAFMSSVLMDSNNIGEDVSALNVPNSTKVQDLLKGNGTTGNVAGNTNTTTGTAPSTPSTPTTPTNNAPEDNSKA